MKKPTTRGRLIAFLLGTLLLTLPQASKAAPLPRPDFDWKGVSLIAIQDRGRLKPLETFAEESVLYITGRRSWAKQNPVETLFGWLIAYDKEWQDEPFVRIDYLQLKEKLGLPVSEKYFSPKALQSIDALKPLVRDAVQKQQNHEKLSDLDKKVMQLQNQIGLLEAIVVGQAWNILPNPEGMNRDWYSLSALAERGQLPYPPAATQKLAELVKDVLSAYSTRNARQWNDAVTNLTPFLRNELSGGQYPSYDRLERESLYNHLRAFHWAWMLYTLAFVILLFFNVTGNKVAKYAGATALVAAFALHATGFIIRSTIAGRPPVTNMYESIIWVTWGCVLFSLVIWAVYKKAIIPTAASAFAIVGLIVADSIPLVLDPSIQPLEPVLRSNYWLTIHVLTITLSYAAFALSLCLGNVVLGNYIFRPKNSAQIQQYSLYMYRAMQIGVVLLATGTILGGVWADYSWGRFWGWDPKEVWALIALLLYLAVLHGRFTGWLRGFGFVASTVVSFLGVLMAWYGVNFVLGVGLHSYGFGTGGMSYVLGYVAAQIAFIFVAYSRYAKLRATQKVDTAIFPRGV